jgi:anti-sigma regulatory factor (Ser/Thr protein kinase)
VTAPTRSQSRLATPLELFLSRDDRAPAQARKAVSAWCEPLGMGGARLQALVLLVSELVSNAVLHSQAPGGSSVTLAARLEGEVLHVSVSDAGQGFEPRPRDPARLSDGYGLFLLDKIASRWGVDAAGETSVWFELPWGEPA